MDFHQENNATHVYVRIYYLFGKPLVMTVLFKMPADGREYHGK